MNFSVNTFGGIIYLSILAELIFIVFFLKSALFYTFFLKSTSPNLGMIVRV